MVFMKFLAQKARVFVRVIKHEQCLRRHLPDLVLLSTERHVQGPALAPSLSCTGISEKQVPLRKEEKSHTSS